MRKVKVKICGLRRQEDIAYANALQPDFIGFVFYEKSKRAVTKEQALELKKQLDKNIKAVGVFVNASQDFIAELVKAGAIDMVQLHGDEDALYCKSLREQLKVPIIKAVRVRDASSLEGLENYAADYFLFDTFVPDAYGGTGKRFDLRLVDKINKPYFIAGGLEVANVSEVIKNTQAFAVDVSGGVETAGLKDKEKMSAFIAQVRGDSK